MDAQMYNLHFVISSGFHVRKHVAIVIAICNGIELGKVPVIFFARLAFHSLSRSPAGKFVPSFQHED
jgi:hypothetical protein